ncbi:hypothetical protein Chor_002385 [Crotalus horridus]
MENIQEEECPLPPPRNDASSPANSYGQQSTATLTPSPREEMRASEDIPRLHQFEIPHLPRRLPNGSGPLPRPSSPPLTQSNPNLNMPEERPEVMLPRQSHRRNLSQTPAHSAENVDSPGQDLPPPPLPPPAEDLSSSAPDSTPRLDCDPSLEKDLSASSAMERKVAHRTVAGQLYHQHRDGNKKKLFPTAGPAFSPGARCQAIALRQEALLPGVPRHPEATDQDVAGPQGIAMRRKDETKCRWHEQSKVTNLASVDLGPGGFLCI